MLFLIDYENVGNAGMKGSNCLNTHDHVIVFYSEAKKHMEQRALEAVSAESWPRTPCNTRCPLPSAARAGIHRRGTSKCPG